MHKFSSKASVSVLCATLGLAAAGCSQINTLKATMAFKDANQLYRGQDFRAAVAKYNEAIDLCRGSESECKDPKLNLEMYRIEPVLLERPPSTLYSGPVTLACPWCGDEVEYQVLSVAAARLQSTAGPAIRRPAPGKAAFCTSTPSSSRRRLRPTTQRRRTSR